MDDFPGTRIQLDPSLQVLSYCLSIQRKVLEENVRKMTQLHDLMFAAEKDPKGMEALENQALKMSQKFHAILHVLSESEHKIRNCINSDRKKLQSIRTAIHAECRRFEAALPIYFCKQTIINTIHSSSVCVIVAETGSGKSTQIPQYLCQMDCLSGGLIACTQPRKVAAISLEMDDFVRKAVDQYLTSMDQRNKYKVLPVFRCSTPDCQGLVKRSNATAVQKCEFCGNKVCRMCAKEPHRGQTCDNVALYNSSLDDDELFNAEWMKQAPNKRKLCPKCKFRIEKSDGCNHMTCPQCKTHFCWVCCEPFSNAQSTYTHLNIAHGGAWP